MITHAQTRNFDGIWTGKVTVSNSQTINFTLYIEDNNVYSVTTNEDGTRAKDTNKDVSWSKGYGEQLNYVWINKGGVWTETQVFSLVLISKGKLSVHYMRHVSNKVKDKDENTDWGYTGTGYLYKE
jgi:hypothetical protein